MSADRHASARRGHRRGVRVAARNHRDSAAAAVAGARSTAASRCWQGRPDDRDLVLVSPIILYDHPEIAEQSKGALYDSTEIDEILTPADHDDDRRGEGAGPAPPIRWPRRSSTAVTTMSPEAMLNLHGVLRNPHAQAEPTTRADVSRRSPEGVDWWDPWPTTRYGPRLDAILVNGARVARGSRVRLRPSRRADAQDLFFADKIARVTSVHEDVDGDQHVGVVLEDDPAADMHDWYGRYLYFAPDEVEPLDRKELRHGSSGLGRHWRRSGRRGSAAWLARTPSIPDARRYMKIRRM